MKLFAIPQIEAPMPLSDASDYWDEFETVSVHEELAFPKDDDKSPEQRAQTGRNGHIGRIRYSETKLKAEGQLFTQRHLADLGVTSRATRSCPFEKSFPMDLLRGSDLKRSPRIPKHENLLADGLLVEIDDFRYANLRVETTAAHYVQDPDDQRTRDFGVFLPITASGHVIKPWKRILFISHRWLDPLGAAASTPHPDDAENGKLAMLRRTLRDDDYAMLDYASFARDTPADREKAIQPLSWHIYHCTSFRALTPDEHSLGDYLERGWCQLEMLTAFCPVLAHTEEHSDGNFYLDFEDTKITKSYVCASPDRAAVTADGELRPVAFSMLRNPQELAFTVATDADRIRGPLEAVIDGLSQSRPRKEQVATQKPRGMTSSPTTTYSYTFDGPTAAEHEAVPALQAR
jgi:hypothetical protein